jgi:hypothetical protein
MVSLHLTSERCSSPSSPGIVWILREPMTQGMRGSHPCHLESESVVRCVNEMDGCVDGKWVKTWNYL